MSTLLLHPFVFWPVVGIAIVCAILMSGISFYRKAYSDGFHEGHAFGLYEGRKKHERKGKQ